MTWLDEIVIDEPVFKRTGATREEILEKYKTSPDAYTRGFVVNGQILGVDCARRANFIFWCCEE